MALFFQPLCKCHQQCFFPAKDFHYFKVIPIIICKSSILNTVCDWTWVIFQRNLHSQFDGISFIEGKNNLTWGKIIGYDCSSQSFSLHLWALRFCHRTKSEKLYMPIRMIMYCGAVIKKVFSEYTALVQSLVYCVTGALLEICEKWPCES